MDPGASASLADRIRSLRTRAGAAGAVRRLARGLEPAAERRARRDEEHMRLLMSFALSADANCIDVGAHEGAMLADILRSAPDGRHIAYEPIPAMAAALAQRFPQVDVRAAALSNRTGTASFIHVTTLPSHSGFRERGYPGPQGSEEIEVSVQRLDDALPAGYVPTLIKIDVEGAEREVIEGAIGTIAAHRPIIVFEHGPGAADRYGTTPDHIHDLLVNEAHLRLFDLEGGGPYDRPSFAAAFARGEHFNWVARA